MLQKSDFQAAIAESISNYPVAAQFYQAQDPRLLAQLDAIATMFAMLSAEIDTASMEMFTKARDVTVLADAAIKGVIPWGVPSRVRIAVANPSPSEALQVLNGRVLFDTKGNSYSVDTGATIPPSGAGFVSAVQLEQSSFNSVVSASIPFYKIPIPPSGAGKYLAGVHIADGAGNVFKYQPDFVNVEVGTRTYHIEGDETGTLNITFGAANISGYQPMVGESFTVTLDYTSSGDFTLTPNSPFAFQYASSQADRTATLKLDSVLDAGSKPMDIATLREVCSFPSVYDSNAVFLGNFDFLLRRNLGKFDFLSVWNEQVEEAVRGASVDNINGLFIAAKMNGVTQSELQDKILAVIKSADDSYRVKFKSVANVYISIAVAAQISSTYDFESVKAQIKELILKQYGQYSDFARRGQVLPLYKDVNKLLTENVEALQSKFSDLQVTITVPNGTPLPEQWRFVDPSSLVINVTQGVYNGGGWAQ